MTIKLLKTITLLMLFFTIKYAFGVFNSLNPEIAKDYLILEIAISLMLSGYFLGKALCYVQKFFKNSS